nr:hypothetical protein [Actinopolyspora righensis]
MARESSQVWIDFYRDDSFSLTDTNTQQSRVPAGSRTDLQYPVSLVYIECVEHIRHKRWLAA